MPKYIIAGGQFNPFTYEELARPVEQAAQAHLATQDALSQYEAQAGTIGSYIGTGEDNARARELYDNYMKSVRDAAEALYERGYNRDSAKALADAKARFGTDISRISQAIENRERRAAEYRQMSAQDRLLAEYDPSTKGLDNWLDNPQYGNFRHYSGKTLIEDGSQIGKNIFKEIRENDQWDSILGSQYWEHVKRNGVSAAEFEAAKDVIATGQSSGNPLVDMLAAEAVGVFNSSGISEWADKDTKNRAFDFIFEGLSDAIGSEARERLKNEAYASPYQWATLAENQRQFNLKIAAQQAANGLGGTGGAGGVGNTFYAGMSDRPVTTEGFGRMSNDIAKQFEKYYGGEGENKKRVSITGLDGKTRVFDDVVEATAFVHDYDHRADVAKDLYGIDIARDPRKFFGLIALDKDKQYGVAPDGRKVRIDLVNGLKDTWEFTYEDRPGHWAVDEERTRIFNEERQAYKERVKQLRSINKAFNIDKVTISPDEESDMREKYGIDQSVSLTDLKDAIQSTEFSGYMKAVDIASAGPNGDFPRKQIAANLETMLLDMGIDMTKDFGKDIGIYRLKNGRPDFNSPVKNGASFIPTQKINKDTIKAVRADIDSISNGGFYVTTTGGEFFVQAQLLGSDFYNFVKDFSELATTVQQSINEQNSLVDKANLRMRFNTVLRNNIHSLLDVSTRLPFYQGPSGTSAKGQGFYGIGTADYDNDEDEE